MLGKRFNFHIINLNKSFILLKKVLSFIKHLSLNNGSLLFYYNKFNTLNIIYKCVLLSIVKQSNQQIITHNWIYGSVSNYFFSFYSIIKDITHSWLTKNIYIINQNKDINRYKNLNYDDKSYNYFDYLFLTSSKEVNSLKINKFYNNWYNNWIKKQQSFDLWKAKKKASKHTSFLKKLCLNNINNVFKKKKIFNFKYLFLKLFYYICRKYKHPLVFEEKLKKDSFSFNYNYVHKKFISYWRIILYFKYFNNFFRLPDALFSITPNNNTIPLREYTSINSVTISLVDSNSSIDNINYPIISNDDSLLIIIFYITLLSNTFIETKLDTYNLLLNNTYNVF